MDRAEREQRTTAQLRAELSKEQARVRRAASPTVTVITSQDSPLERLRAALPKEIADDVVQEFHAMSRGLFLGPSELVIDQLVTARSAEQLRGAMKVHQFIEEHGRWPESLQEARRARPKRSGRGQQPTVLDRSEPTAEDREQARLRQRYEVALQPAVQAARAAALRVAPSDIMRLSAVEREALWMMVAESSDWFARLTRAIKH